MIRHAIFGAIAPALLLASCKGSEHGNSAEQPLADNITTSTPVSNAGAPAPTAGGSAFLSLYVGKHPSEPLSGRTFLEQPTVKGAVEATVPDPAIRDFIFHYNGPDAPIVGKNGRLLAWGCEAHNCGYHNWSILITPEQPDAEICFYHDDKRSDGPSRWFLPGGRTETRPGNCPSA